MIKGILFNTDMVRAILDGRKTVTRRVINTDISNQFDVEVDGRVICYIDQATGDRFAPEKLCRYQPGDVLYVRETWSRLIKVNDDGYQAGRYVYKASDDYPFGEKYIVKFRWHPSIHMPKSAARIWLRVTDVRVERLQEITVPDMIKEGVRAFGCEPCLELNGRCKPQTKEDGFCGVEDQAEDMFSDLWDSTIKKSDLTSYGWDANPWVWVIEFERCEKPEEKNNG